MPAELTLTLDATRDQLIHNPATLANNWGGAGMNTAFDGRTFRNYYAGYVPHTNGTNLLLQLEAESDKSVTVSISPRGRSSSLAARIPYVESGMGHSVSEKCELLTTQNSKQTVQDGDSRRGDLRFKIGAKGPV